MVSKNNSFLFAHIWRLILGEFHHDLLSKTAKWKADQTLVNIVRTIADNIDHPEIGSSINPGLIIVCFIHSDFVL